MSIVRVGEFRAAAGQEAALLDFLKTIVAPGIQTAAGNESVAVLQSQADPALFLVIEAWANAAAHQASAQEIPRELVQQVMAMLAAAPTGGYYLPR